MWGRRRNNFKSAKVDTLLGHSAEIEGDISFTGGLHLDGTIKGNVIADDDSNSILILSERGRIEGDVRVPQVLLNGTVVGDVYASQRVELAKHARVSGNVYYNLLEMTMGAEINGNLVHRDPSEKPLLADQSLIHEDVSELETK
ncbi:MAG: polymer-forming cytoskeletal protein [Gammaproteobacteria bacterium]|nr:polymer-forming cytoskeletal protein [Gammaproteobacteria bacterium]